MLLPSNGIAHLFPDICETVLCRKNICQLIQQTVLVVLPYIILRKAGPAEFSKLFRRWNAAGRANYPP